MTNKIRTKTNTAVMVLCEPADPFPQIPYTG